MADENYRNTWAEINLTAIGYNIQQLNERLPVGSKSMTVVKANGYGHGSVEVANVAVEAGIDYLMVALLEEAVHLRKHGITVPILVIGRTPPAYAHIAAEHKITLTVFQEKWLEELASEKFTRRLQLHLELETGMGRTGISSESELKQVVARAQGMSQVEISGVYTHFATADEATSSYYKKQKERFFEMLASFKAIHQADVIVHSGNSAAGIQYPKEMQHYTRFGIATYGLYPSHTVKCHQLVPLRQAFSLFSELIYVKQVEAGQTISYGATYKAEETEWIGTVPIGYADGWRRDLQGFHVLVDGKKMPIVGRICMDLMMVKLDKSYATGERVTLIGRDGYEEITVDDVADYLGTINYEVTCMISSRVPRIYRTY